jgi:hypothetical protein
MMAYPINFDEATAVRFLQALRSGRAIEPPGGRWTIHAMLALAGACHFAASTHGPPAFTGDASAWERLPHEHKEARMGTLFEDLRRAIEFYSHLTMLVQVGEYDDRFAAHVEAIVYRGDREDRVAPRTGFRST